MRLNTLKEDGAGLRKNVQQWNAYLRRVDVFSGLSAKERRAILAGAFQKVVTRQESICESRSPADFLYALTRGPAKTLMGADGGRRLLVDFVKPGAILGEESVLTGGDYDIDAVPFDKCSVLCIPSENVVEALQSQPKLGRALAALSAARARALRERLFQVSTAPVATRVAGALYHLAKCFGKRSRNGTVIELRITHRDLADYVAASRETTTSVLSRFRKNGLIIMNVRKIVVPDMKELRKAAC